MSEADVDGRANALYLSVRTHVLAEAPSVEAYPGELAMLRGLLGMVRVISQHSDIDELRRVLAEYDIDESAAYVEQREKATAQAASVTPALTDRQARLLSTRKGGGS